MSASAVTANNVPAFVSIFVSSVWLDEKPCKRGVQDRD
jgi:hypothetical protein